VPRWFYLPSIAIASIAAFAIPAKADPIMSVSVTGGSVQSIAGGVSVTSGAFSGSEFFFVGSPVIGTTGEPQLDLSGLVLASSPSGPSTLVFQITQTGNVAKPGSSWVFDSEFSDTALLATSGVTISYASYAGTDNLAFDEGAPLSSKTFTTTGSLSNLADATINSSLFSVTEIITITATGTYIGSVGATFSGVDPVPEPASLTLFGSSLIGLGALMYRKSRRT